jgi:hypothetical protein
MLHVFHQEADFHQSIFSRIKQSQNASTIITTDTAIKVFKGLHCVGVSQSSNGIYCTCAKWQALFLLSTIMGSHFIGEETEAPSYEVEEPGVELSIGLHHYTTFAPSQLCSESCHGIFKVEGSV